MKLKFPNSLTACAACAGLLFGAVSFAQAQNDVTFQVDMTKQIDLGNFTPGADTVFARGAFNNWGNSPNAPLPLTNNPAAANPNIYSGVSNITDTAGSAEAYKYYVDRGQNWESPASTCGDNRTFTLAGGAQTLPAVFFNDDPVVSPTNDVTFSVDMSAQILGGAFTPGSSSVYCRGSFNNWGNSGLPPAMTNNPNAANPNVYSSVLPITAVPGACQAYKFYIDTGANWESPVSTGGGNRTFKIVGGPQALPTVYFNDQSAVDLLAVDTDVTFTVNMTNAVGTDAHAFDPTVDTVYINGDFLGWWSWGAFPPGQYQMTNNPVGSELYTLTFTIPKGKSLSLTYKYSINGQDNEAGFAQNHLRFIRTLPGGYQMPTDTFANQFTEPLPTNGKSFGELKVGPAAAGHVPVTWLGLPGVRLQTASSIRSPVWVDHFETDGTNWTSGFISNDGFISQTNYPSGGGTFFRLARPN